LLREGRQAARIVDLADTTRSVLLDMPSDVVDGVFSPDESRVVIAAGDRAWVWSVRTGDLEMTLDGHLDVVRALAFRSTGELVTAGMDGAIFTWALDGWADSFRDGVRDVSEMALPTDGRTLVYHFPDGRMKGISADPGIWFERACAIAGRGLSPKEWRDVFADRPYDPACATGSSSALRE
ncbi:MAG TPA: hypothetical protein VJU58_01265, partial [Microbacterium sp.]|nr:hypothetical protein [Microbacterium sp.]